MATVKVCDECGELATCSGYLPTGRVMKDGRDIGQYFDFCAAHAPRTWEQPHNTTRVKFYWPPPVRSEGASLDARP